MIALCKRKGRVVPGSVFGRLTTLGEPFYLWVDRSTPRQPRQRISFAVCECQCGTILVVECSGLKTGNSSSCGCKRLEHVSQGNRTHGLTTGSTKRIYSIWKGMRSRCCDSRCASHKAYGERGITVCDEWISDPMVFCIWALTHGYDDGLVLDRVDPDGNYEPSNCQWITNLANVQKQKTDRLAKLEQLRAEISDLKAENGRLKKLLAETN